jgi:lactoylglutathione lyase
METRKVHRGRLIDHVQIISKDLLASRRFYDAVFSELGVPLGGEGDGFFWYDELFVSSTHVDPSASEPIGPMHLAFQAPHEEAVRRFYAAGLQAGGKDDGSPGERKHYHPGYFAAFLIDPDGNFVEAVFHGVAKRSAASVEIGW